MLCFCFLLFRLFFLRFHLHSQWIEELLFLVKMSGPSGARQTGSSDVIIPWDQYHKYMFTEADGAVKIGKIFMA